MESCCSVKALVGGVCGYDPKDRKCDSEIVPFCLAIRKSTITSLYSGAPLYGHPLYTDSFVCPDKTLIYFLQN